VKEISLKFGIRIGSNKEYIEKENSKIYPKMKSSMA
jgi:hypothetical protein